MRSYECSMDGVSSFGLNCDPLKANVGSGHSPPQERSRPCL
ncbi:MAG: hypothetical protein ACKO34_01795 [Vampirovibrionales bacterium]